MQYLINLWKAFVYLISFEELATNIHTISGFLLFSAGFFLWFFGVAFTLLFLTKVLGVWSFPLLLIVAITYTAHTRISKE